jgi:hypothetical protein
MTNPSGNIKTNVMVIFDTKSRLMRFSNSIGNIKRESKIKLAHRARLTFNLLMIFFPRIFFEKKLPIPDEKSKEKIMIDVE